MSDGSLGKLILGIFLATLIVGVIIGIAYLFLYLFVLTFNWFTDMMIIKGANPSWAAIVALVLVVFIFNGISRNATVNNYIQRKVIKRKEF